MWYSEVSVLGMEIQEAGREKQTKATVAPGFFHLPIQPLSTAATLLKYTTGASHLSTVYAGLHPNQPGAAAVLPP